jgi:hypothetical protein
MKRKTGLMKMPHRTGNRTIENHRNRAVLAVVRMLREPELMSFLALFERSLATSY